MKIVWSNAALQDVETIQSYLEKHNPAYAWSTVDRITQAADSLKKFPSRARIGGDGETREYVMQDIPYLIVYHALTDIVYIVRVMHTSRRWPEE